MTLERSYDLGKVILLWKGYIILERLYNLG